MRGELDPVRRRELVRHLLGGCADCGAVTRGFWRLGDLASSFEEPDEAPRTTAVPEPGISDGAAAGPMSLAERAVPDGAAAGPTPAAVPEPGAPLPAAS